LTPSVVRNPTLPKTSDSDAANLEVTVRKGADFSQAG